MLNKKSGKLLSLYWFAIITLTAGGVFVMVYLFYGAPYDVREIESHILMNQVADCVSYLGRINPDLISGGVVSSNSENFLESCHLNFSSIEWEREQFYAEVTFYQLADLDNSFFEIKKGNSDFVSECNIQGKEKYNNLVQCREGSFYSVDELNNQYIIKILTAVRKTEKNVK
jgi:hypothetical protein